jgi:hypothetical protein
MGLLRPGIVLALLVTWGCMQPAEQRFSQTFSSPEALASQVVLALKTRDRTLLESLPLTEREFEDEVYPEMPAAKSVPAAYVWGDLRQKSTNALARALHNHGGRDYDVAAVRFDGGHTSYRTFVVHRKPRLIVFDRQSGRERHLAILGSILQYGGRYKLFSYVVNR